MQPKFWEVPALWPGQTVVILAGGPSLTQEQVDACRGRVRVIAINDAYQLAPWCDLHYFCDEKWYVWHFGGTWGGKQYAGDRRFRALTCPLVTLENVQLLARDARLKSLRNYGRDGLSELRDGVMTGRNGGYQALNLAVHLVSEKREPQRAGRIVLLGYDMRAVQGKLHWFGDHPQPTPPDVFRQMLECYPTLVEPLKRRGVAVINATPGSALDCFPRMELEQCLARPQHSAPARDAQASSSGTNRITDARPSAAA